MLERFGTQNENEPNYLPEKSPESRRENFDDVSPVYNAEVIQRVESVNKEYSHVQKLVEAIESIREDKLFGGEPDENIISNISGMSSSEIPGVIDQLLQQKSELAESISQKKDFNDKLYKDLVEDVQILTTEDAVKLVDSIEKLRLHLHEAGEMYKQQRDLEVTYKEVLSLYLEKSLAENEFSSFEDVYDTIQSLEDDIDAKRREFLGGLRNRADIKKIEAEIRRLEDLYELYAQYGDYNGGYNSEWYFQEAKGKICRGVVRKISEYNKRELQRLSEEEVSVESIPLRPGIKEVLADELIKNGLQKEFDSRLEEGRQYLDANQGSLASAMDAWRSNVEHLSDQDIRKEAEDIIRQVLLFDNNELNNKEERGVLQEKLQALPDGVKYITYNFFSTTRGIGFQQMSDLVRQVPYFQERQKREKIASEIGQVQDHDPYMDRALADLQHSAFYKKMKSIFTEGGLNLSRWEVFKQNEDIQEIFGDEPLVTLEAVAKEVILNKLLSGEAHTKESVYTAERLMHFRDSEIAPYILLNAFREPGESGEKPFLSSEYFESLPESEKDSLRHSTIPGVAQAVEIIENESDAFSPYLKQEEELLALEKNPHYQALQESVAQTCLHYITNGSNQERDFALRTFARLEEVAVSEDMSPALLDLIESGEATKLVAEAVLPHAENNDLIAGKLLLASLGQYGHYLHNKKAHILRSMESFGDLDETVIEVLADVLGVSKEVVSETAQLRQQLKSEFKSIDLGYSEEDSQNLMKLAVYREELVPLLHRLKEYGYSFRMYDTEALIEIVKNKENILTSLEEISTIFPEYRYSYFEFGLEAGKKVIDPYELFPEGRFENIISHLEEPKNEDEVVNRKITRGLIHFLRRRDRIATTSKESEERFHDAVLDLAQTLKTHEVEDGPLRSFFLNETTLRYLARQPERAGEVISMFEEVPTLLNLISPGGPLYDNRDQIIGNIFSKDDALRRAKEVERIFAKPTPYWKQLFLYTESRIGDKLKEARSSYPIDHIAGVPLDSLIKKHRDAKEEEHKSTTLETVLPHVSTETLEQLSSGEITSVPFNALSETHKRLVLRDYLRKTVEYSRSEDKKREADKINRTNAADTLTFADGDYLHGSSVDSIEGVLLNGNLPQECLGPEADTDAYPFHVDLTRIVDNGGDIDQKTAEQLMLESISGFYGGGQESSGQIFYIYKKDLRKWEKEKDYNAGSPDHGLVLGGMPATEIHGIALKSKEAFRKVRQAVLDNGFYIPIYDIKGDLIFTVEEYDKERSNQNLSVPVEIWDYSLKTGEKRGSNPGAEFTIPTDEGPTKYYVKFTEQQEDHHVWNEQLADNIYRHMGITVPDTKVVKVEGSYGHASEIIEGIVEGDNVEKLKEGFVVDSLLANWDIPYAPHRNTGGKGDELYRLDNGGALLFRARGDKKTNEEFGEVVTELGVGTDKERLGLGARQEYPGLTLDDVKKQAEELKGRLTDGAIDTLVDGVRLEQKDRDYLKDILKKRRDYIISQVLT